MDKNHAGQNAVNNKVTRDRVTNESRLIHEANESLRALRQKRDRLSRQFEHLMTFEDWILTTESKKNNGGIYYDLILKSSGERKYLGGEQHEQVLNVKRYRYAKKALSVMNKDIRLLESLLKGYINPDYDTINSLLPMTYQTQLNQSTLSSTGMPQEAIGWMQRLEEEKAQYPPFKPEQLKHPALNKEKMRSKSEVIIANILLNAGIPFVYESPLLINGKNVLPDFRILSLIDLKTEIIIEHQGMVFIEEYANKFIRSLKLYLQTDWVPNKNLFFTFDNAQEILDPEQVITILRKYVDPSI